MHVPSLTKESENNNFECYIGFVPAELLARMYEDFGPKLVERNVRSFYKQGEQIKGFVTHSKIRSKQHVCCL